MGWPYGAVYDSSPASRLGLWLPKVLHGKEDQLTQKARLANTLLPEFRATLVNAAVTEEIDSAKLREKELVDRQFDRIQEAARA